MRSDDDREVEQLKLDNERLRVELEALTYRPGRSEKVIVATQESAHYPQDEENVVVEAIVARKHAEDRLNKISENNMALAEARAIFENKYRSARERNSQWQIQDEARRQHVKVLEHLLSSHHIAFPSFEAPRPSPSPLLTTGKRQRAPETPASTFGRTRLRHDIAAAVALDTPTPAARAEDDNAKHARLHVPSKLQGTISPPDAVTSVDLPGENPIESFVDVLQEPKLPPLQPHCILDTALVTPHTKSSSSTQGDPEDLPDINAQNTSNPDVVIKEEPYSDPVITDVRHVKRKRERSRSQKADDDNLRPAFKIEDNSGNPAGLAEMRYLQPEESLDLDEIGEKVDTPRKRRHSKSGTPEAIQGTRSFPGRNAVRQDQSTPLRIIGAKPRLGPSSTVLQPKSPNKQVLPRTSDGRPVKRRRERDLAADVDLFAEDGENGPATGTPMLKTKLEMLKSRTPAEQQELARRLGGLLEKPSPQRKVLLSTPSHPHTTTRAAVGPRSFNDDDSSESSTARQVADFNRRLADAGRQDRPGVTRKSFATIVSKTPTMRHSGSVILNKGDGFSSHITDGPIPEDELLRARPLHRLGIEHFKVNPHYNEGFNYSFKSVVRKKDDRKCLPGCVRAGCCGDQFRSLAELILDSRLQRETDSLSSSQEAADDRIIGETLGVSADSARVRTMGKKDRTDILVKAKATELANKLGKHRHAYERGQSPPGYWRADFPTTQEHEEDRRAGKEREREIVEMRYAVAMRGGGAWLFRDE